MNFAEFLKPRGDKLIWGTIILMALFSILAVYSSTKALAFRTDGSTEWFALKHARFLIAGLFVMFAAHKIDYNYYSGIAKYCLYTCVPVLLLTLLFGRDGRWLTLPFTSTEFQPSEIAKFVLIMYLARVISKNQDNIKTFKDGLIPILVPVLLVCGLILPADFSTSILILITSFIMMIIGRVNYKYTLGLFTIGMVSITFFFTWLLKAPDHLLLGRTKVWKTRLLLYKNNMFAENSKDHLSYQEKLAYIAIANGGLLGQGPGKSHQKNFLPEAYSDYIYAVIAEEYGFVGAMFVIFLYLFFFYRCILIFIKSPGNFGALLAVSLALSLVIQALMNIMVTVGLLPVTGVTLPLISRGGTSILITCLAIGVILSVDHYIELNNNKPQKRRKKKPSPKKATPKPTDKTDKKLGGLDLGKI